MVMIGYRSNFLIDSQYGPVPPLHKGMGLAAALVIVVFISSIARVRSSLV